MINRIYRFFFPKIEKELKILEGYNYAAELWLTPIKGLLLYLIFLVLVFLLQYIFDSISFIEIDILSPSNYFEHSPFIIMCIILLLFIVHHIIRGFYLLLHRFVSLGYSLNDAIFFYLPIINIFYSIFQGKFKLTAIYMFFFPILFKSFGIENLNKRYKKKKEEIQRKYQEIKFELVKNNKDFNKLDIENEMKTELNLTKDDIINNFVEQSLEQRKQTINIDFYAIEKKKLKTIASYLIE